MPTSRTSGSTKRSYHVTVLQSCTQSEILSPQPFKGRYSQILHRFRHRGVREMDATMSLVPGWYPPSREHWELISYGWQFFPLVCDSCCCASRTMLTTPTVVHSVPMVYNILSTRQDINGIEVQSTRQMGLVRHGVTRHPHSSLLHAHHSKATRH